MNIQDWFPLGLSNLISLQSKGLPRGLLQHHSSKASILQHLVFFTIQLSHPYMTTGRTIAFTIQTFVSKVLSLLSSKLFRFVIAFLPRSKCLLISWLQSPSTVILEPNKIKSGTVSIVSPIYLPLSDGTGSHHLRFFGCWAFSQLFHSFTFSKRLFSSSSFSAIRVLSSAYSSLLIFLPALLIPAWSFT